MADPVDKDTVKEAIREVVDEVGNTYAHGAGLFVDSLIVNLSNIGDSFDDYYTRNLMRDRPRVAETFLELRIRSVRKADEQLQATLKKLQGLLMQLKGRSRQSRSRQSRSRRTGSTLSRKPRRKRT
jgi:hypothetical protein